MTPRPVAICGDGPRSCPGAALSSPAADRPRGAVLRLRTQADHIGSAAEGIGRAGHGLHGQAPTVVLRLGAVARVDLQPAALRSGAHYHAGAAGSGDTRTQLPTLAPGLL